MLRLDGHLAQPVIRNRQPAMGNDRLINIITPQPGIAIGGENLKHPAAQFENGDIECPTAKIIDSHLRFLPQPLKAVCQRSGSRLVDDPLDGQPCQLTSSLGSRPLGVIEIGGHSDDSAANRGLKHRLGLPLEMRKDQGGDLLRRVFLPANGHTYRRSRASGQTIRHPARLFPRPPSHVAFDGIHSILRINRAYSSRRRTHERLPLRGKVDYRGRQPLPITIRQQNWKSRLHDADEGIGSAEVYADDHPRKRKVEFANPNSKFEIRNQKSEVRSQKSEKTGFRSPPPAKPIFRISDFEFRVSPPPSPHAPARPLLHHRRGWREP